MIKLLAIRTDGVDMPGRLALRRQPAEGGHRQVADGGAAHHPAERSRRRGIDVGTKQEIYQLLRQLADAGAAIIFYSTDYDELIGCCNRVLVLYDGARQAQRSSEPRSPSGR